MLDRGKKSREVNNVTNEEAYRIINENEDILLLDVSNPEDYCRNHLKNAISIPYREIREKMTQLEQYKNRKILVYCKTGRGSAVAVTALVCKKFKNIYHMYQGLEFWKYEKEEFQWEEIIEDRL